MQLVATMACILKNAPPPPLRKSFDDFGPSPQLSMFATQLRVDMNWNPAYLAATHRASSKPDYFNLQPPTHPTFPSLPRFSSVRERDRERDLSPMNPSSPGSSSPNPSRPPVNASSWSLLNSSFNILGGSYGSSGGNGSNPSGFHFSTGRGSERRTSERGAGERRGSDRRDSSAELTGAGPSSSTTGGGFHFDLASPVLGHHGHSDPIPVKSQSMSDKDRTKIQSVSRDPPANQGISRPGGGSGNGTGPMTTTMDGGGSFRSKVSFNSATSGGGMLSSVGGGGSTSGVGTSYLQRKMSGKDQTTSSGAGSLAAIGEASGTSMGKKRMGIKATYIQPRPTETYVGKPRVAVWSCWVHSCE